MTRDWTLDHTCRDIVNRIDGKQIKFDMLMNMQMEKISKETSNDMAEFQDVHLQKAFSEAENLPNIRTPMTANCTVKPGFGLLWI